MRFLLILFFLFPLMADEVVDYDFFEEDEENHLLSSVTCSTQSSASSDATTESKEKPASGSIRTICSAKLEKNEFQPLISLPKLSLGQSSIQPSPKPGEVMPQLMELATEALKCLEPLGLLF